ncbi:MAG: hypothetical protein JXX28_14790 [Deltaproteobacteria bacterium]|nr:hypothetical protein [Deltaproteobacteria bacterium]
MLVSLLLAAALAAPEDVLISELERSLAALPQAEEPVHYLALTVQDRDVLRLSASGGAVEQRARERRRTLDVDLRVGTPELDSTHALRGFSSLETDERDRRLVPLDGDEALRHAVWAEVDARYRAASERIVMLRSEASVKVEEEDSAPDFEVRQGQVYREELAPIAIDEASWLATLTRLSVTLDGSPAVIGSRAGLEAVAEGDTLVDSEGARLVHGRTHYRVTLAVRTVAEDGDEVSLVRTADAHRVEGLPDEAALDALARALVDEVGALREAPRATPYVGPVVLSGRATAVFFHEIFGHRVEGHRQKSEDEGKTFAERVGQPILPDFISVVDDPTLSTLGGVDLNGFYRFDDEGVAAQRVSLVEDGVFQGFLMGRTPIEGFAASNGHGRRSAGHMPTSRMGNTLISARGGLSDEALEARLLDEVRAQGLPYGYWVEDIDGGFTQTGRVSPNAFNVRAVTVWRVFPDGRPRELVRGVDLVGTPLTAFDAMIAASEQVEVFNGTCGAESGWVPVSAAAPAMLFRRLEFQLKEKGQERPPLLDKPEVSP